MSDPFTDPFAPKRWLLAYNLPSRTWDSCGYTKEMEAQYEREFFDLYRATAPDRNTAEQMAKEQRRMEAHLTARQREVLGSLVAEVLQDQDTPGSDPLTTCVDIPSDEHRVCRALAQKGLLTIVVDDPEENASWTSAHLEVKLTWAGLNGRPRDPLKMLAARRYRNANEVVPAPERRRSRLRS